MKAKGKKSAGILLYRYRGIELEVFLVHPGGPFWKRKESGAWSVPKGEYAEEEDPLSAAVREVYEETGVKPHGPYSELGEAKMKSGKVVVVWAAKGDAGVVFVKSNLFSLEWPPRSGKMCDFPEVDRAEWFTLEEARVKINPGQVIFLERLSALLENGDF
jgi:predicted NUDIX family NTP pyrophosphohydrolase